MKTKQFKAELIGIIPNSKNERIRTTKGVDGADHISISCLFLPLSEEDDTFADGDAFTLNFRKSDVKKAHIYRLLEKIAKCEDASTEESTLINEFKKINANLVRGKCPLYFVHDMVNGVAKMRMFKSDHKVVAKRNQPQFGNKVVVYWHGEETGEEMFDDKFDSIQKNSMFVTAESAKDVIGDITTEAVKEMMTAAIERHAQRVAANKVAPKPAEQLESVKTEETEA